VNWAVFMAHPYRTLAGWFGVCWVAFLLLIPLPRVDGMLIGSDGVGYYVYVRSLVFDGDLDFTNEYSRLLPKFDPGSPTTITGLRPNQFAIGPGLLWLPFFVLVHGILLLLSGLGLPVVVDGYSYAYQAAICTGSMVYGALGMGLMYATVRRWWPRTALAACGLLWFGTNFIYYQVFEPSMSHMGSLFAVSLLIYLWLRFRPYQRWQTWFVLGLSGGLVALVRQPDVTLLLLPVLDGWLECAPLRRKIQGSLALGVGFGLVFAIQMRTWAILNGSPWQSGYLDGRQGFSWLHPKLLEVLFALQHGLYVWHPILLLATLGWAVVWATNKRLAVLFGLGFASQVYCIAAWSSWAQGDAFGGRMFLAVLPLFVFGLAGGLEWAIRHGYGWACWGAGVVLIGWNGLFLLQYRLGFISMNGPYTLAELTLGKGEMLIALWNRLIALVKR
jgi:hypothetical protein